ncbi:MAG: phosphoglycolate phosphatase [Thermodesulfovibrio sp.]|nr:phosphoglycolate phosphatase [Thermodesulfovibrio sp.]
MFSGGWMIKLIMFDLDGTLVDSGVDITNALNHALLPCGVPALTVGQTISLVGEGVTRLIEKVVGSDELMRRDEVLARFLDYYSAHLTIETRPYPGVVRAIEKLSDRRKAVISNKLESLSRRILADLELLQHLDLVLGGDSLDEKKPSPMPLLRVMESLAIRPAESVIVGDSSFDIQAGKAAGVRTVAVSYGFRAADTLREADFIIDSMDELSALLEQLDAAER